MGNGNQSQPATDTAEYFIQRADATLRKFSFDKSKYYEAISFLKEAIRIKEKDALGNVDMNLYYKISDIFIHLGEVTNSIEFLLEMIGKYRELADKIQILFRIIDICSHFEYFNKMDKIYRYAGDIYANKDDFERSYEYYAKSLDYMKDKDLPYIRCEILVKMFNASINIANFVNAGIIAKRLIDIESIIPTKNLNNRLMLDCLITFITDPTEVMKTLDLYAERYPNFGKSQQFSFITEIYININNNEPIDIIIDNYDRKIKINPYTLKILSYIKLINKSIG